MARCGIRLRYPVKIIRVYDDGSVGEDRIIGDAETLSEAIAMAEQNGFQVKDGSEGGSARLAQNSVDSKLYFIVTIYPQAG
jgi:hypothetical protein